MIGTITDTNKKPCINTDDANQNTSIDSLYPANFKCSEEILSRPGDLPYFITINRNFWFGAGPI